jgi:hypothetical protein
VLPLACAVGHALDLHHARWLCSTTLREGVRRADGSLDRAGFLGGTADMIRSAARLQGLDAMRAEGREEGWPSYTQLMRAVIVGDEKRVRELVTAGAKLNLISSGYGWSALHYASHGGHVGIARLLLDGKYEGKGAANQPAGKRRRLDGACLGELRRPRGRRAPSARARRGRDAADQQRPHGAVLGPPLQPRRSRGAARGTRRARVRRRRRPPSLRDQSIGSDYACVRCVLIFFFCEGACRLHARAPPA